MKINTKVVRISAGVCLSNHTVKKKIIKYAFVGINSRTTLHLAFLMFLLYIISVRKIWTQSPVLIGFFVLLPTGEERSSLWLLRDRTGHSNQRVFSIKRQTALQFQSFKVYHLLSPSYSLPPVSCFIAVQFSERTKRNFGEKVPTAVSQRHCHLSQRKQQ